MPYTDRIYAVDSQSKLDRLIWDLTDEGYPYTGSHASRWQYVPELDAFLWDVPGEPEWEYTLHSKDDLDDSVNGWWYDY